MGDLLFNVKFDEQDFNEQMNKCRMNFFNSLSEVLINYRIQGTTPVTIENQDKLDKSWINLNTSLDTIKILKQTFLTSIGKLITITQELDDAITNQNNIKISLNKKIKDLSGSKETSIGMLDGSKITRTHVLYGNYLLSIICIIIIVFGVKQFTPITLGK